MNVASKTIITASKSAFLATTLLGLALIGMNEGKISRVLPFILLVVLLTFLISVFGVILSILPFYYHGKNDPLAVIFKKYFPLYALIIFKACLIFTVLSQQMDAVILFGITYITAMFAWIWFFKPKKSND